MSYNISCWKTKKIENLKVPLSAFFESERKDWHPKQPVKLDHFSDRYVIKCGCEQEIICTIKNKIIQIFEFNMTGEGSGSFLWYVLKNALSKSTGYIEAVLIWENGDYIERLTVCNGKVQKKEVVL